MADSRVGDAVQRDGWYRWVLPVAGNGLVISIAAARLLTSSLSGTQWLAELVLVVAALVISAVTWRARWSARLTPAAKVLQERLLDITLITVALVVGSPVVERFPLLVVVAMLTVTLTLDTTMPVRILALIQVAALGGITVVCWAAGLGNPRGGWVEVVSMLGLVAGLNALVYANLLVLSHHSRRQTTRLRAVASAARRLGLATDRTAVAEAAIGACRETYPDTTYAAVLVADAGATRLHSLPVYLGPEGVTAAGLSGSDGVSAREGICGLAISTGRTQLANSSAEAAALYAPMKADAVSRLAALGGGSHVRSFIAAPMRSSEGRVMGVLLLNSHRRDAVWGPDDLPVVEGIADETAISLERVQLYDEQREQASTDPLTGLRNRRDFEARLQAMDGAALAVLVIDVDNLKRANDEHGHEAGDGILRAVASVLAAHVRSGDALSRIGGDEFAVAMPGASLPSARDVARRIRRTLYAMALAHGPARVSIGVATGADAQAVWRSADAALVEAKRRGRDRISVRAGHGGSRRDNVDALQQIFDGGLAVRPVFQPIVDIVDGTLMGVEALARLGDASGGQSADGVEDLFAAAHAGHVLRDLDWLCRRSALHAARRLTHDVPVFINVSTASLLDPVHQVDQMLLLLSWAERSPQSVVLEITERETVSDMRRLGYVLASYREWGFRFALDDIGEGHSTLELLAAATPDYLKIARSLVVGSAQPGARAAVEAAVAFARAAGKTVIAEGVETEAAAARVSNFGIHLGQGWWLGMPAPADALAWGRGSRAAVSARAPESSG